MYKRQISIFRAYAEKFRVCSRAIFCRISSCSSGVTGTRRTIFRVQFVIVSPRFLGVWGTPQQALIDYMEKQPELHDSEFQSIMEDAIEREKKDPTQKTVQMCIRDSTPPRRSHTVIPSPAFVQSGIAFSVCGLSIQTRSVPFRTIPVSYTHLDVYKRQINMRLRF